MRPRRIILALAGGLILGPALAAAAILAGEIRVRQAAAGRLHDAVETVERRPAALVLGCAKTLPNGRPNLYFALRVKAAAALWHGGKADYLIVSGDNHRAGYDEPTDLRDALAAAGVPEDRIYRDYAGFRTLDSVVRAKEVFGQDSIIVVSQRFHNERALYLARAHGIEAEGFNAADVTRRAGARTRARESLARVKTLLDVHLFQVRPKFLGPPVALGGPPT